MRRTYQILAHVIALLVMVQAASAVFAVAGINRYVMDGGVVDKALMESKQADFTGAIGIPIHAITGQMVIPVVALALLIVSFMAHIPKGPMFAGVILGLVVIQVLLGIFGHQVPYLGILHGINALVLFTVALMAGMRVRHLNRDNTPEPTPTATTS